MVIDCGFFEIRSWQRGDAESLPLHANNKAIWQNLRDSFPHPYEQVDAERWLNFVVDPVEETNFALAVDGEAVGNIGLRLGDDIDRCSAELWYWLGEKHWGKGIVSTALMAFTDYAFTEYNLTRLYALPFAHNIGSVRALQKAGFRCEGLLPWSAVKEGKVVDKLLYAYLSSDWLKKKTLPT